MTVATIELSTSLHSADCGCLAEEDYRGFEATVKRAHPYAWAWAKNKHPDDDTPYIDRRNKLGRNPKRDPNLDAVPKSRQRHLTKDERLEHKRRKARWAWVDRRTYDDDDDSLVECFVYGRMSLAQAVKFIEIADEIPSRSST